jgi:hypothetical protein
MTFHDYTISADGGVISHRVWDSAALVAPAVDAFRPFARGALNGPVHPDFAHIDLRVTVIGGAAVATFTANGQIGTFSVLATTPEDQAIITDALQRIAHQFGSAIGELHIEYPAIVSMPFPGTNEADMGLIADMETCLAAAFFTRP